MLQCVQQYTCMIISLQRFRLQPIYGVVWWRPYKPDHVDRTVSTSHVYDNAALCVTLLLIRIALSTFLLGCRCGAWHLLSVGRLALVVSPHIV